MNQDGRKAALVLLISLFVMFLLPQFFVWWIVLVMAVAVYESRDFYGYVWRQVKRLFNPTSKW
jgi:hypothetical protein